jgi:hypothetical protein
LNFRTRDGGILIRQPIRPQEKFVKNFTYSVNGSWSATLVLAIGFSYQNEKQTVSAGTLAVSRPQRTGLKITALRARVNFRFNNYSRFLSEVFCVGVRNG